MQKTAPKNTKYSRNKTILKVGHFGKMLILGQKLKFQKTCRNRFYQHNKVVLYKKPLQKTPNIGEIRRFWKSAILARLCKMIIWGQKLKIQKKYRNRFYEHNKVVLCKKPLQKTPNIREIRRFWKSAILARL